MQIWETIEQMEIKDNNANKSTKSVTFKPDVVEHPDVTTERHNQLQRRQTKSSKKKKKKDKLLEYQG